LSAEFLQASSKQWREELEVSSAQNAKESKMCLVAVSAKFRGRSIRQCQSADSRQKTLSEKSGKEKSQKTRQNNTHDS
jgi:hypothetical protein